MVAAAEGGLNFRHAAVLHERMDINRRCFLTAVGALAAGATLAQPALVPVRRPFGPGGGSVPVIGLGTWLTFDVSDEPAELAQRGEVLRRFFAAGGGMIDSSPMYGKAEQVLGRLLPTLGHAGRLVAATKVWTPFDRMGRHQLENSLRLWGLPRFDVLLVHNLVNWQGHLKTLRAWKDQGRVRHIGISTSHGNKHDEAERVLRSEPLDVLQITYNFADTRAESLMQLAADRGMAAVVNRPFDGGHLFTRVGRRPPPGWAADAGCADWPQFFLKWIVSHPAVSCAIPATRNPAHLDENMRAGQGRWPDAGQRSRMMAYMQSL
jgi:aryl-alcohol dehydrogenase-like predicted oxidoreductase